MTCLRTSDQPVNFDIRLTSIEPQDHGFVIESRVMSRVCRTYASARFIWGLYRIITRTLGLSRPTEAEPPADYAGIPLKQRRTS